MDLRLLFSFAFALSLPVWLVVEQLLHTLRPPSGAGEGVPTAPRERSRAARGHGVRPAPAGPGTTFREVVFTASPPR